MTNATDDQVRYACPSWCQADDHPRSGTYDPYDEQWTGVPMHRVVFGTMTSGVNAARVEVYWLDNDPYGPQVCIAGYEMDAGTASVGMAGEGG